MGSTALMETNVNDQNPTMYIFFNGARIARIDPGAAAKYYVTDNVGSTAVETDAQGNVLNASLFFPYGVERIVQQNDTANNYRFSGKERDPQTGLDDFGARYYDSSLGRFTTPDWDAKPTAVPYASFGDPQTLNLYSYVENGPLNRVDADGHADQVVPNSAMTPLAECYDQGSSSGCPGGQAAGQVSSGIDHDTSDANNRAHADQAAANAGNGAAQPAQAQQQNTGQGQQNQSDKPGFSITAGHGNLELTNTDTGHTVGDYGYVSGMNGDTNQADAGKGPIPSGKYTLDPKEISSHWWRKLFMSDWGDYRVPLHPEAGTDTHGRSGFFLHGGGVHWEETRYGSEGCIKVFDLNQNRLFQLLQGARGPVEVTVQ